MSARPWTGRRGTIVGRDDEPVVPPPPMSGASPLPPLLRHAAGLRRSMGPWRGGDPAGVGMRAEWGPAAAHGPGWHARH